MLYAIFSKLCNYSSLQVKSTIYDFQYLLTSKLESCSINANIHGYFVQTHIIIGKLSPITLYTDNFFASISKNVNFLN